MAERFGPTFQGEGVTAGQRAVFLRLSGCNLTCSFCDEPHTWDWRRFDRSEHSEAIRARALVDWLLAQPAERVVVTGGESLLQQRRLVPLVAELHRAGRRVEIETNGTVVPADDLVAAIDRFTISPKLSGSEVPEPRRIVPAALRAFAGLSSVAFKFVVSRPAEEIEEIAALEARFGTLADRWAIDLTVSQELDLSRAGKSPTAFASISDMISALSGRPVRVGSPFWQLTKTEIVAWYLAEGLPAADLLRHHPRRRPDPPPTRRPVRSGARTVRRRDPPGQHDHGDESEQPLAVPRPPRRPATTPRQPARPDPRPRRPDTGRPDRRATPARPASARPGRRPGPRLPPDHYPMTPRRSRWNLEPLRPGGHEHVR
ncbi:7-carboxy-7-deazaguanine synthase QueE [Frankia sp. CcWB3]